MYKIKKNKTIRKNSKKCVYTDETKRILKYTRRIKRLNKLFLKNKKT